MNTKQDRKTLMVLIQQQLAMEKMTFITSFSLQLLLQIKTLEHRIQLVVLPFTEPN